LVSQAGIVANSLKDYLNRHPEISEKLSKNGQREFLTTDDPIKFNQMGSMFFAGPIQSNHCSLGK
jgi:glutamate racemase